MNFTEKLRELTKGKNKSEIARRARLSPTAIADYLQKNYIPRGDNALALARALQVSVEWLLDDAQGFPAPPVAAAASLSNEQLAEELGRRMLPIGLAMAARIFRAQKTDWVNVAEELLRLDPDQALPKKLRELMEIPAQLNGLASELRHYEPRGQVGQTAPAEILKEVQPDYELGLMDLLAWHRNLNSTPGYPQTLNLSALWLGREFRPPWFAENVKHTRKTVVAELAELKKHVTTHRVTHQTVEPTRAKRKIQRD